MPQLNQYEFRNYNRAFQEPGLHNFHDSSIDNNAGIQDFRNRVPLLIVFKVVIRIRIFFCRRSGCQLPGCDRCGKDFRQFLVSHNQADIAQQRVNADGDRQVQHTRQNSCINLRDQKGNNQTGNQTQRASDQITGGNTLQVIADVIGHFFAFAIEHRRKFIKQNSKDECENNLQPDSLSCIQNLTVSRVHSCIDLPDQIKQAQSCQYTNHRKDASK